MIKLIFINTYIKLHVKYNIVYNLYCYEIVADTFFQQKIALRTTNRLILYRKKSLDYIRSLFIFICFFRQNVVLSLKKKLCNIIISISTRYIIHYICYKNHESVNSIFLAFYFIRL